MNDSLVDIYFKKRKNNLYHYSKYISNMIFIKNNKLYSNVKEFNSFVRDIIDIYYDDEMQLRGKDFNFNYLNGLVNNYFKGKLNQQAFNIYNKELFLLSTTIYLAVFLDNIINPWSETKPNYCDIIEQTLNKIAKANPFLTLSIKPNKLKEFSKAIFNNEKVEKQFFESINNVAYNTYIPFDSLVFKVKFNYRIEELNEYQEKFVSETYNRKKIDYDFLDISLELLSVTILKQVLLGKKNRYIVYVPDGYFDLKGSLKKLNRNFKKDRIKKNLILVVKVFDEVTNGLINDGYTVGVIKAGTNVINVKYKSSEYQLTENIISSDNKELNDIEVLL